MSVRNLTRLYRPACLLASAATFIIGADYSSAGIQGTGRIASLGRIDGTGNTISVDGVDYGLSQAQIRDRWKIRQCRPAQNGIRRRAGYPERTGKGNANSVTFTGNVVGPITGVDVAGGTFTVLGQQVIVDAATVFGDGLQPAGIGSLGVGLGVEVSAYRNASGELLASRIDLQTAEYPYRCKVPSRRSIPMRKTSQINSLTIAYGQARVNGKPANASTATVTADAAPSAGTLQATTVAVSNGIPGAGAGVNGQVEGLVTSINSESSFYVGDQLVLTNSQTNFALQGNTLQVNLAVKVSGNFDASGALLAQHVHLDHRHDPKLSLKADT